MAHPRHAAADPAMPRHDEPILIRCAAACDAHRRVTDGAAILVADDRIQTLTATRDAAAPASARVVDLPDHLVLPAMVNAHAHLDLTSLGPRPCEGDFLDWVRQVMANRPTEDDAITRAVHQGLALSRAGGVGWVGDIAGSAIAAKAMIESANHYDIAGVTYLECFGHGAHAAAAARDIEAVRRDLAGHRATGVRVDLQPHAPYSAGLSLYEAAAARRGAAPATHLAETHAEAVFVRDAAGPFADLLRAIGKWDTTIEPRGCSPVAFLADVLARAPWLVAHGNYVEDADIAILARTGTSVAYCPIASDYFGHRGHRYRDMLAAGVNVCLGTDSILCQPPDAAQPLGVLGAMRYLHRRDGVDAAQLLAMATTRGAAALRLPEATATLQPGAPARLAAVRIDPASPIDPLTQVLRSDYPVRTIEIGQQSRG